MLFSLGDSVLVFIFVLYLMRKKEWMSLVSSELYCSKPGEGTIDEGGGGSGEDGGGGGDNPSRWLLLIGSLFLKTACIHLFFLLVAFLAM
uniref:Uncharacterized protein n=1 Tax=Cannabis sativa TaxID=3483 RepID=A0A803P1A5_CANSA